MSGSAINGGLIYHLGHYSYRKRDNSNNKHAPDFIPVSSNTSLTAVSPTIEINEEFKNLCNNVP